MNAPINTATEMVNDLMARELESEPITRLLRFLIEAANTDTAGIDDMLERLWNQYMMEPVEWNGKPAVHGAIQAVTELYLERTTAAHAEAYATEKRGRGGDV